MTTTGVLDEDLKMLLADFQIFKDNYVKCEDERRGLKGQIARLKDELENAKELEVSHRTTLASTRKLVLELQSQVTKLAACKDENKKCLEKVFTIDEKLRALEQEKISLIEIHREEIYNIKKAQQEKVEEMSKQFEMKVHQSRNDIELMSAQSACVVGELNDQLATLRKDSEEKANLLVLDYEEKLQRAHAQATQLRDEHHALLANLDIYRKKVEEQEQKIRFLEITHSGATAISSGYDYQPNGAKSTAAAKSSNSTSAYGSVAPISSIYAQTPASSKPPKPPAKPSYASLQIVQSGPPAATTPKGGFNAVKKRKLYSNGADNYF